MTAKVWVSGLAFVVVLVGLALFLRPESVKSSAICPLHLLLRADGVVAFDGAQFSDDEKLKARLVSYKMKNPERFLSTVSDKGVQSKLINHIARIMHDAGFSSVGFIIKPHSLSD